LSKNEEFNKITIRPVTIKKKPCFQAERFKNNQVFHLNMTSDEFWNEVHDLKVKNDITLEYYILKNIPINDRGEFYELAKIYYGKCFSDNARNGHTIANVTKLIKKAVQRYFDRFFIIFEIFLPTNGTYMV